MVNNYSDISPIYIMAMILIIGLFVESLIKYKSKIWSLPALTIYTTTLIWYFTEFIYTPENLSEFSKFAIENSFFQVILFLITFRLFLPSFTRRLLRNSQQLSWTTSIWQPRKLLFFIAVIWGLLLLYGIARMNGDVFGALFPIQSRAGGHMWGRAAAGGAGSTGFIVSAASYTYLLSTSFLGVLLVLQKRSTTKIINLVLLIIALPYFFLMGARNQLLAVLMPSYFCYILLSRGKWWVKAVVTIALFFLLNQILTIIIAYRDIGFDAFINSGNLSLENISEKKHLGLNMFEELCYINTFSQQGMLNISYGGGYLVEFLNIIPRAIWVNKPLIGIDYALLRGFGGGNNDIGVVATISTGFIGQGVVNFGPWLGAVAPGILLAAWSAWIARLRAQSYSTLRLCLFLAALGVTFNLGRDITLLVLFPVVFGYLIVRFFEYLGRKRRPNNTPDFHLDLIH